MAAAPGRWAEWAGLVSQLGAGEMQSVVTGGRALQLLVARSAPSLIRLPRFPLAARGRRGVYQLPASATTGGGVFNTPHMNILSCAPPPGRDVERVDSGGALQPVVGREPHGRRLCAEVWQQHHGCVGWLLCGCCFGHACLWQCTAIAVTCVLQPCCKLVASFVPAQRCCYRKVGYG